MRTSRTGSLISASTGRDGFSLVELLVVIGIIGVLTGLVLATVGRVRGQADRVKCAAQLQQLGAAFSSFSNDHKGWLPVWSGWHVYPPGSSPEDDPGESWTEQLAPYYVVPDSPVYSCPSFDGQVVTYFMSARWSASKGRRSMRTSEIRLPAQFVFSGDMTNRDLYAPPYGQARFRRSNDCDPDDSSAPCASFPEGGGYLTHRSGNNVLFADLHVQSFRQFEPAAMTFDAYAMRPWSDVRSPDILP
jgi:prepilin-type N-terminal cleavage/methylation domain-containing protein/prepilin-type processing-associated H-X9-DG protein